jgi:valyl-tRNA synthetase
MTSEAGKFEGLDRFKCRDAVIKELKKTGLLKKIEPYNHSVGHCYRCKTVVEPNLSLQWFVKTGPLAEKAIQAVEKGDTKIIPEIWTKTYFEWMNNIRDWCISRQIWWGHQIPAWTCEDCEELVVAMDTPESCPVCKGTRLDQETDVLDTWFSSALWPFSTMGWPEKTPLLNMFYPTSVLVTGFDILFFWIARMMMMGIHFMGDVPFKDVYVHALVRDVEGKKMSKSKGNVIDPISVIDKYGTDAFRFTLAAFAAQGRDIKMSEDRVEGYRHFINKLWNAARFAFMHITEENSKPFSLTASRRARARPPCSRTVAAGRGRSAFSLSLPDRWILSRLNCVTGNVSEAIDSYRFNDAAGALYRFVWHEFCDWYLEAIKPSLYGKLGEDRRQTTMSVLWFVLQDTLILLHPFIPFVTEEIWHKLPGAQGSIMKALFPLDRPDIDNYRRDNDAESKMELITGIITGVRNIRGEMNITPSLLLDVSVQLRDGKTQETLNQHRDIIINLAGLKTFLIEPPGEKPKAAATGVVETATIYVLLEGIIDFAKEINRLEKEIGKLANELTVVSRKLSNEDFLNKAPWDVVEKVKEKQRILLEKELKLEVNMDKIREFTNNP